MTPNELRKARKRLGLSQAGLAEALRMGANGGRTVRRWELGEIPVTGPASKAVELMIREAEQGGNNG
jgi:DNA-binding transcriptional regulator YiaG